MFIEGKYAVRGYIIVLVLASMLNYLSLAEAIPTLGTSVSASPPASELPPASSPFSPPTRFPVELVFAAIADIAGIAIITVTSVVLKKKLQ